MANRKGDWIQTYTSKQFWPLDPRPEDVCIEDIAHALAMKCRYNGHCSRFYSVAQHSVLVSLAEPIPLLERKEALLHDAAEAYLPDVPRPIKPLLTGFAEIEENIDRAIAERFGLTYPWPDQVHRVDGQILADESKALMGDPPADWRLPFPPLNTPIHSWFWFDAKKKFLNRASDLGLS